MADNEATSLLAQQAGPTELQDSHLEEGDTPLIGEIHITGGDGPDDPLTVNGWLRLPLTEEEIANLPKAP